VRGDAAVESGTWRFKQWWMPCLEARRPGLTWGAPRRARALLGACCPDCGDYQDGPSAGCVLLEAYFFEAGFPALSHE
jgi:hypothetical protein